MDAGRQLSRLGHLQSLACSARHYPSMTQSSCPDRPEPVPFEWDILAWLAVLFELGQYSWILSIVALVLPV